MTMSLFRSVLLTVVVVAVVQAHQHVADDSNDFTFQVNDYPIPTGGLSDMTATRIGSSMNVYIAGGCDHPLGNVYNKEYGEFVCETLSDRLLIFDASSQQFQSIAGPAKLPQERYRHAAAGIDSSQTLWLVGGRSVDDSLITTVDVYSVADNTWQSFDLPEKYQSSDNTGWAYGDYAYFAGGYPADYSTWLDTVFRIDTVATLSTGALVIEDRAPLLTGRGDVSSTIFEHPGQTPYVVVAGGFGPNLGWCAPDADVFIYDFEKDTWDNSTYTNLNRARSDKGILELNGQLLVFGGESQLENICQIESPEPGEKTVAVDDVELYDTTTNTWVSLYDLPKHTFRFAPVAFDELNSIFAFGGQYAYDESCECFRTSNDVMVFTAQPGSIVAASPNNGGNTATSGAVTTVGVSSFLTVMAMTIANLLI